MNCDELMTRDVVSLRPTDRVDAGRTHVEEIMTRELLTCHAGDNVQRAEELMVARRKNRILVLDSEGRLAGVISLADIAAHDDAARAIQTIQRIANRELRA